MPAQTIEEVKTDMVKYFGERVRASKYFEDYARIGSYLSDRKQYKPALGTLDCAMAWKFMRRLQMACPGIDLRKTGNLEREYLQVSHVIGRPLRPPKALNADIKDAGAKALALFKKLLTECLAENERTHDFDVAEDNVVDLVVGLPLKFNELLKARKPFKDVGAGKEHGEYSHRIQWYLISKMTTLQHPVAEIYEKLPGWFAKDPKNASSRNFYMWEFLVDRDGVPSNASSIIYKTEEQRDFRAPSNLNRWLTSNEAAVRFSWLHTWLKRRWDKREGQDLIQYIATKILKAPYREVADKPFNAAFATYQEGIVTRGGVHK
jgi:hypothetical protein